MQLTLPHARSDWHENLSEVLACYQEVARAVTAHQLLMVVAHSEDAVVQALEESENLRIVAGISSNDTWTRDHGPIAVFAGDTPVLRDFAFNGWGLKYPANYDNLITQRVFEQGVFKRNVVYTNQLDTVLEGGSIESDGAGTVLTTTQCLLDPNRNGYQRQGEAEAMLAQYLGAERVLWLHHGYLAGDDTDSHIDTLVRFCNQDTIAYVQCTERADEHFAALRLMEQELQQWRTATGKPYNLVPLPMAMPVWADNGLRLPATYANFLIINKAVLLPVYDSPRDQEAFDILCALFPNHEIVPINALPLIKQHGSLHCITMQYPAGFCD